jgi:uncharacterized membrane protein
MRIASVGHAFFALVMVALGILGLTSGTFGQLWQPVPKWVPAQHALAYLCALIALGSGLGLLWRRTAPTASRMLFASLTVWLLVMRVPNLFYEKPLVLVAWSFGSTAVMAAGAWVLYIWFGGDERGLRFARALFGLSLIPFGLAHFMYLDATMVLIPAWLPGHVAWAYFTGAAFIAAGLANITGVLGRLAASLTTLQIGLFGLIIWIPRVLTGNLTEFQRGEAISNFVLMAGAWMIAESYRRPSSIVSEPFGVAGEQLPPALDLHGVRPDHAAERSAG